ncbi:MAG TPA: HIT domain-containing protein [Candidatus Saccharimonadales bacterium]|nr:HIT domain-containing protein [Candidatus Saccharimonadales bacterium]
MAQKLSPEEQKKQEYYRDARVSGKYDKIWQSVGKCVFCDLNEKYVFFEEGGIAMTISLYAYIDGHFMIVPRRHVRSVKELTPLEWQTIRKFMYIAKKIIREVHGIKGMQTILKEGQDAQSTVQHIHFHCIPFDAPDLSTWHYRRLKNTPYENVSIYKKNHKKITQLSQRFDKRYKDGKV